MKIAILIVCLAAALSAASTQFWQTSEFGEFLAGRFEGVALDREGRLQLAPNLAAVFQTGEAVAWTTATGPDGDLYVGTGHQGRLYKVGADGKSALLWKAPEIEIFAVAVGPDGRIYAGTSPEGKVYRLTPEGESEVFFDPEGEYIWSLLFGPDGRLFVATGPSGVIYAVDSEGNGGKFFESGQRHVLTLGLDNEGRLLAGTDPSGVLYRITPSGRASALYDSDLPEIRSLAIDGDGTIYAAALGGGASMSDQVVQSVSTATFSVTASASPDEQGAAALATAAPQIAPTPTIPSEPIVSYAIENSALYRIRPDLTVDKLWSSREENILGMALGESARVYFVTDNSGRLYRWSEDDEVGLAAELNRQPTGLAAAGRALRLTLANGAEVRRLETQPASEGKYRSRVHDAGRPARWGRLTWRGTGDVSIRTRSGNSERPDASWSDWSAPVEAAEGAPVASPPGRYLQWEATLAQGPTPPRIERVQVAYLPQNAPPVLRSVEISEQSAADQDSSSGPSPANPGAYSITVSASGDSSASSPDSSASPKRNGKLVVSWTAEDADGEPLVARVEFRGEGENAWKTLRRDVRQSRISIEEDLLADGRYRFRVHVSDSLSNPPAAARSAQRVSGPVIIDHTPPEVRIEGLDGRRTLRFTASDAGSAIVAAAYAVDGGRWIPAAATDGVADSPAESFEVSFEALPPGEHLIAVRVEDRAGNVGLAKTLTQ